MKGFIYTIIIIVILAIVAVVLLGRDGTTPSGNNNEEGNKNGSAMEENDSMDSDENTATTTNDTATSTSSNTSEQDEEATDGNTADTNITVIELTGKNFEFSKKNITVQKGDRVRIEFKSTDGFHDWVVDKFDAKTNRVQTGETASVEFVADTAGEFEYYCSVGSHRELGMVGTLIVEE